MEAPFAKTIVQPFIYQYNIDNLKYEIELNTYNNMLFIKATNKSKLENSLYSYEETLENIYKLDRYFMIFENIEDIKNNINEIMKEKECVDLKINKENELELIIKTLVGKQVKNIEFILTKKEGNNDNLINVLIDKINTLENKIKEFEELKDLFSEEIKEKKELKKYLIGESITTIKRIREYNFLKEGIYSQFENFRGKLIQLKLIFKSPRDGNTTKDFHKFCDNKGPTISIIKTKENIIFGGFLSIKWKNEGEGKKDNKAFLFSFNKNKIYKNNNEGNAAFFLDSKGPCFSYGFTLNNNFYEPNMQYVRTKRDSKRNWSNFTSDFELNENRENFDVEEIEIFEVIIN